MSDWKEQWRGKKEGLLFVLSGPSGVGKDVALKLVQQQSDIDLHFIVTMTTRPARPGEVNGRDYHFVSIQEFQQLIQQGELLEWAHVYDDYKGIPKQPVREALAAGQDVILRIDVQGAATIRRMAPQAVFIFLAPGSMAELEQRLRKRHTESPEALAKRLALAPLEMAELTKFDYVVVNRDGALAEAVEQIKAIVIAERCRVNRRHVTL